MHQPQSSSQTIQVVLHAGIQLGNTINGNTSAHKETNILVKAQASKQIHNPNNY